MFSGFQIRIVDAVAEARALPRGDQPTVRIDGAPVVVVGLPGSGNTVGLRDLKVGENSFLRRTLLRIGAGIVTTTELFKQDALMCVESSPVVLWFRWPRQLSWWSFSNDADSPQTRSPVTFYPTELEHLPCTLTICPCVDIIENARQKSNKSPSLVVSSLCSSARNGTWRSFSD